MVSPFWKEDIIIIIGGRERLCARGRLRERKRKKERATAANSHVVSILFFEEVRVPVWCMLRGPSQDLLKRLLIMGGTASKTTAAAANSSTPTVVFVLGGQGTEHAVLNIVRDYKFTHLSAERLCAHMKSARQIEHGGAND